MPGESAAHFEWLEKAGEDELSIEAILKGGGAPSTACFLSQQMAEKYLKGLAVSYKIPFPKVHDLLALETLLMERQPNISRIHGDLEILNRYYIETRYPGDYPTFSLDEGHKAFEAALRVKEFILAKISEIEKKNLR